MKNMTSFATPPPLNIIGQRSLQRIKAITGIHDKQFPSNFLKQRRIKHGKKGQEKEILLQFFSGNGL